MEIDVANRAASPTRSPFLPYDVLIRLVAQLSMKDILSCSLVCKLFHEVTLHPSIWAHILQLQWNRGRRCIADLDCSGDGLRRDIICSLAAERNWRDRPKCRSVKHMDLFHRHIQCDQSFLQWQSNIIACRLFLPTANEVIEYDTITQEIISRFQSLPYDMLNFVCCHGNVHILLKLHYTKTTPDVDMPSRPPILSILQLLPTSLDNGGGSQRTTATKESRGIQTLIDPHENRRINFVRILDASRRILFCTFVCETDLGFLIVIDWDACQPCVIHVKSNLNSFIDSYFIDAYLCEDGANEFLVLRTMSHAYRVEHHHDEEHICYALDDLRKHERWIDTDADLSLTSIFPTAHPIRTKVVKWTRNWNEDPFLLDPDDVSLFRPLTFTTDWQLGVAEGHDGRTGSTIESSDRLESTFLLYKRSRLAPAHRLWFIVHSYTRNYRPLPLAPTRCFISLVGPRLGAGTIPITCLSMNHAGWIEAREAIPPLSAEGGSSHASRLVFMLVTLPDPLEPSRATVGHDLRTTARELDIPNNILQRATDAWMNPAMGTITIVTHYNRLNVYSY